MASQEVISALETLHREIEKLEPAIKHVETAQQVTQMVKAIPQKHVELLTEVMKNDAKHKEDLKNLFATELSGLTEENKRLQKTTSEIQQQVKLEHEALVKLKETVQAFHERVEKINFPDRLDKLDANIAGIMSAIQVIQGRLDIVERNIADKIRDLQDYQKETRTALQTAVNTTAQKLQIFTYITWVLVVAVIIINFVLNK